MNRSPSSELWTAAQAAASDRHTMDTLGVPSPLLMERAALCVARRVAALCGCGPRPVGVLVGPGNNGADGLAVARQLRQWGIEAEAWLVTERRNEAAAEQLRLARIYGVVVHDGPPDPSLDAGARLWVDAMLGTGSAGALRGPVEATVAWLDTHRPPCIAVDIPTGVDADTGAVGGAAVRACSTVTFERSKVGLHITPGRDHAGTVIVGAIGLVSDPDPAVDSAGAPATGAVGLVQSDRVATWLSELPPAAHKGQRGHVGVVGGSRGTAGAALLASVAALRVGAGLVTVASPDPDVAAALLAARPEVMTAALGDRPLVPRADALVVGPGLTDGLDPSALARLYLEDPRPAVWDASALDRIPVGGTRPAAARVVTPHPGEAARMLEARRNVAEAGEPYTAAVVQARRLSAGRALGAALPGAVVVLKGAGTLVLGPSGCTVATRGSAALATAGSGDVLSGVVGALLARGLDAEVAAIVGVHLHGLAGERLAEAGATAVGPVAMDVAEQLPGAWADALADHGSGELGEHAPDLWSLAPR